MRVSQLKWIELLEYVTSPVMKRNSLRKEFKNMISLERMQSNEGKDVGKLVGREREKG